MHSPRQSSVFEPPSSAGKKERGKVVLSLRSVKVSKVLISPHIVSSFRIRSDLRFSFAFFSVLIHTRERDEEREKAHFDIA